MERGGTRTNKSVLNYFHSHDLSCICQFGICKLSCRQFLSGLLRTNCERPRARHDNVVCFCLVFDISLLRCPCLFMDAQNMDAVMTRLRRLEDAQTATVDSCLEEFRHLIKSPMFTKDRALDRLLNLKMVAKEANHPKSGFFEAVFRALREKTGAMDDGQFTKYLEVLLGDKESIAKSG